MSDHSESGLNPETVAARLLAYGEEERRRVARELHDDISQRLALLADDADQLRREAGLSDGANRIRLNSLVQQARSLSEDLRTISHKLHPAIIEDLGLAVALRSLTRHFSEKTKMPATLLAADLPRDLPLEISTALYRIVQEALRNITKHAGQTSVSVTLETQSAGLGLIVSDLGTGFDPAVRKGLGLVSMRERAFLAGGTFTLVSAPSKGTTIYVWVPLSKVLAN